ncbi:hypothetical protein GQ55_9G441000 [Panicum hallii var. hallii]|uniref:Uncharacterized protein n=1 Tax=Panicum hallii var. hallii TaxID=1504633 RepID=A0A2T7CBD7_9POAL|nr:hypothetical protein GQ55_9G441000 [Panicum hallii var. hallii]
MAGGPNVAGLVEDDAISVIIEGEVVCEICGSGSAPHLIANCAPPLSFLYLYCMRVLTLLIPRIWFCYRCQRNANRAPRP